MFDIQDDMNGRDEYEDTHSIDPSDGYADNFVDNLPKSISGQNREPYGRSLNR